MRKSPVFILIFFLAITFSATAQKKKIRFQSINQFAMVGGESNVNSAFQTINGIKFKNWSSGIGIGMDYYNYRTLPLFLDGRWYFGDEKKGFFYGDLGYNFPMKNKPGKDIYNYTYYHFNGGIYTDVGLGFQTKFIKKSSLLFSLGHSYKELQIKTGRPSPCENCQANFYDYKFKYGRMILKAGLTF